MSIQALELSYHDFFEISQISLSTMLHSFIAYLHRWIRVPFISISYPRVNHVATNNGDEPKKPLEGKAMEN
ncbi:hypothetical protein Hdeb2414_s0018g00523131 [Helianthus debilis subsp. tardiflorus]